MLPNWLENRYKILWDSYKDSAFRFEGAAGVLKEKKHDSEDQINVFLSELRKRGLLKVEFDPEDARKRIYRLQSIDRIISETLSINKNQFTTSRENAEILRQLVELFSAKPLHHVSPDILGDAYEWILRYFAPQKAKEGEVYTPREVIKLIVEILNPNPGESVYDT